MPPGSCARKGASWLSHLTRWRSAWRECAETRPVELTAWARRSCGGSPGYGDGGSLSCATVGRPRVADRQRPSARSLCLFPKLRPIGRLGARLAAVVLGPTGGYPRGRRYCGFSHRGRDRARPLVGAVDTCCLLGCSKCYDRIEHHLAGERAMATGMPSQVLRSVMDAYGGSRLVRAHGAVAHLVPGGGGAQAHGGVPHFQQEARPLRLSGANTGGTY